MSINRVCVSGNLTREPELRMSAVGTAVLNFGMAVNDRRKNPQTGEWEDVPNFIECAVFGKRAEALSRFLSKGAKVCIDGRLRQSSWETRDGQRRSRVEVVAEDVELMQQRGEQQAAPAYQQPYVQPQQAPAADVYDEDIPF